MSWAVAQARSLAVLSWWLLALGAVTALLLLGALGAVWRRRKEMRYG